ncbi:MAG: bifunctional riboflavin kinase/FMN adenylyltransferase, partial [Phycisphaerae bacterium]|nr:bifunctional riboflavin kinase/FMN adenylyltransferase [Phycisphaerae bacterium]
MIVFRQLNEVDAAAAGGSLTIGNFDGVHLGHQRLIARAAELARPVVVMSFQPHPMAVLNPRQAPPELTPVELRLRLLEQAGADAVLVMPVTRELLGLEPEAFVRTVVADRFRPRVVVEGPDFGFGRGRCGDIDTLAALGRSFGFGVEVVHGVQRLLPGHHEPVTISSTLIRRLIGGGAVDAAAECLGRPYRLVGRCVTGRGQGRRIGFPTANVAVESQLLPADGVYAGVARSGGGQWPAAISIGPAPTFEFTEPAVEAHLP